MEEMTVAISQQGLENFANLLVADIIINALQGLTPPDKIIDNVPDVLLEVDADPSAPTKTWAKKIEIDLTNGALKDFNPSFTSLTQNAGGQFDLLIEASDLTATYTWNEWYREYEEGGRGWRGNRNKHGPYDYSMKIGTLGITVHMTLSDIKSGTDAGGYMLKVTSVTPDPQKMSPKIPGDSVIEKDADCFDNNVQSATKDALEKIDFTTPLEAALTGLFGTIPTSGQLTEDIVFNFSEGDDKLSFPSDKGLRVGVSGNVTYKGTSFGGTPDPNPPLPSIDPTKDIHFFLTAYEFNALYWAFYQAGALNYEITPGMLTDQSYLSTDFFETQWGELYNKYPSADMTLGIVPTAASTLTIPQVYELTAAAIQGLKGQLPDDIIDKLSPMANEIYPNETAFYNALINHIGGDAATQYKKLLENLALQTITDVSHSFTATYNVLWHDDNKEPVKVPVLVMSVTEQDYLSDFSLGLGKSPVTKQTVQTLTFNFKVKSASATFISSPFTDVNTDTFGALWIGVFRPVYGEILNDLGKTGIPLPSIDKFLFNNATVSLFPGYVGILANVQMQTGTQVLADMMVKHLATATASGGG